MSDHKSAVLLARAILRAPHNYVWKLQGMGKFQLDLDENTSLHVWNNAQRFPNVSMIHTHPWNFTSTILWGELTNILYSETTVHSAEDYTHKWTEVNLDIGRLEVPSYHTRLTGKELLYRSGSVYHQYAHEIHETKIIPGTVTICTRNRFGDNRTARVFWPKDRTFGSAMPRLATPVEIATMAKLALEGAR
jgi:hypothetical protein